MFSDFTDTQSKAQQAAGRVGASMGPSTPNQSKPRLTKPNQPKPGAALPNQPKPGAAQPTRPAHNTTPRAGSQTPQSTPFGSIDNDVFFARPAPVNAKEQAKRAALGTSLANDAFYGAKEAASEPAARQISRSVYKFAWFLFAMGTATVFLLQGNLLVQILVGAPIFEEFWKFSLALLMIAPAFYPSLGHKILGILWLFVGGLVAFGAWMMSPWGDWFTGMLVAIPAVGLVLLAQNAHRPGLAWRLPAIAVALLTGLFFGVFEHAVGYSSEPNEIYLGRVLFHSATSGMSMACFLVLRGIHRWWSTIIATVIHYVNNFMALTLGLLGLFSETINIASLIFHGAWIVVTLAAFVFCLSRPNTVSRFARRLTLRHLPVQSAWEANAKSG